MQKKIDRFSLILFGGVIFGSIALGVIHKDPMTGIEYEEIRVNGETVVEQKCPNGEISRWTKSLEDAKIAFPNEALEKGLEQEALYDSIKGSIIRAISKKSPEALKKMLQSCRDQKAFVVQHPHLLQEVRQRLDRMNADEEFRTTVIDALVEFGYSAE